MNESNNQSSSSLIPFNLNSNSLKRKYHPKDKLNLVKNLKKIVHTKNSNFFFNKLIKVDFCKIDTQGFEYNILKNLNDNNFKKIKVFQIEFMLDDIYKYNSQDNFSKIINLLIKKKFKIFDISNIFKTIKDSRTLWIDCIFVNTKYYNL